MDYDNDPIWAAVHPIVGGMLRDFGLQPQGLRGFPVRPRLDRAGLAEVALWLAQRARPGVPPKHLDRHDRAVAAVREFLDTESSASRAQVLQAARIPRSPKLQDCARSVAATLVSPLPQRVVQALATRVCRGLAADPHPLAIELEEVVLRAECQSAINPYSTEPIAVSRVLWRGARGSGPAGHFLFRTEDRYGLLTKLRSRWQVVVDDLDGVLASVPEPWFAEATAAILEPSVGPLP